MQTVDTHSAEILEGWFATGNSAQIRDSVIDPGESRADDASAMYFDLEPGAALGERIDGANAILIVMKGAVELQVDDERQHATPGTVAVVPAMASHTIRNAGEETARVLGFFPSPTVIATFAEPIQPMRESVLVFGGGAGESAAN